jgi:hypothetical protein
MSRSPGLPDGFSPVAGTLHLSRGNPREPDWQRTGF